MKTLLCKAYAKINICLNVTGKRKDGYHTLDMVMLPLELHDSLLVHPLPESASNHYVTIDDFSCGTLKYNIATTSIEKLADKYKFNQKFQITIHKNIPMQSGLGGGSADAAAALLAVNKMMNLNMSPEELINISAGLGADIPFFTQNVPARCQGIGEILTPVKVKNDYYCLIVKPREGCSTKGVYEVSDQMKLETGNVETVIKALETGDDELLAKSIFNALDKPAITLVPEIQTIINKLKQLGLKIVQMSGSGSSVFALSTNKNELKEAAKIFEDSYRVELTKVLK